FFSFWMVSVSTNVSSTCVFASSDVAGGVGLGTATLCAFPVAPNQLAFACRQMTVQSKQTARVTARDTVRLEFIMSSNFSSAPADGSMPPQDEDRQFLIRFS